MAAHQKKARDLKATLTFTDETGFLLGPLPRRTLAPRGRTPVLRHRARRRDKVSVAGALSLSPGRGLVRLDYHVYPGLYVDAQVYAVFLRDLLRQIRGDLVVVHDRGNMHRGGPLRELEASFPRLHLFDLPTYAPELNPVEAVWNFAKDKQLSNFVPLDVPQLEAGVVRCLNDVAADPARLRTFYTQSPLPWHNTTFIF